MLSESSIDLLDYLSNDKMNIINYPLIKPGKQVKIGGFFMQKKECVCEVSLTKEEFIDIINRLRESSELVDKVNELFQNSMDNLECDFCNGASLQISHEGIVVKLLEKLMQDRYENISYFIYELDYGKEYQDGCISDKHGNIDISTPEKLYDFLVAEYEEKNKPVEDNMNEERR